MSGYDLTREYRVPVELVWRALTEADLVAACSTLVCRWCWSGLRPRRERRLSIAPERN